MIKFKDFIDALTDLDQVIYVECPDTSWKFEGEVTDLTLGKLQTYGDYGCNEFCSYKSASLDTTGISFTLRRM